MLEVRGGQATRRGTSYYTQQNMQKPAGHFVWVSIVLLGPDSAESDPANIASSALSAPPPGHTRK